MEFSALDLQLQSDIDDEVGLNAFHSRWKRWLYLGRGMAYINDILKVNRKRCYITYQEHVDIYDLPSDFIRILSVYDMRNQRAMIPMKADAENRKYDGVPLAFIVDDIRNQIQFEAYPQDSASLMSDAYTAGDSYIDVFGTDAMWDATIIEWATGQISKVTTNEAISDISYAGLTFPARRYYVSQNAFGDIADADHVKGTSLVFPDVYIDYMYEPADPAKEIIGTADDTDFIVISGSVKVGYEIEYDGETRVLTEQTSSSPPTYTLSAAFTDDFTQQTVRVYRVGDSPDLPSTLHKLIPEAAMIYALRNESRFDEADNQEQRVFSHIRKLKVNEVQEACMTYNNMPSRNPILRY